MILTSIDTQRLMAVLPRFRKALVDADQALPVRVLDWVTSHIPDGDLMRLSTEAHHHAQAVSLCRSFGFGIRECSPKAWFTWDGLAVAVDLEPSVIIHEVAHYQCAAPYRRTVPDFGLGAGPETGVGTVAANAVQRLFGAFVDVEEGLTSLLGILWEAELNQPAVLAFLEQNWMEGGDDPRNVAHFVKMTMTLHALGLIDDEGHPTRNLRQIEDAPFFDGWFSS
jgi:hypothetical protein